MSWTQERTELLKKLWTDGLSATQIADELGSITRNAVIGKVHRLELPGRPKSPSSSAPRARKPRAHMMRIPRPPTNKKLAEEMAQEAELEGSETLIPVGQRCSMFNLTEDTCRWPIGDPADLFRRPEHFYFCGGKPLAGLPYCHYHSRISYQPPGERKKRGDNRPFRHW